MTPPFDLDSAAVEPATTMADLDAALGRIAEVVRIGNERLGRKWRDLTSSEHVVRALRHVLEWQVGRDPEDLEHAATRLLMGLQLAVNEPTTRKDTTNEDLGMAEG